MSTMISEPNIQGLTEQEARERLAQHGYNELPSTQKRTLLHMILDVIKEPMFMLLLACGSLYLLPGDKEEALMLLGFAFISCAMSGAGSPAQGQLRSLLDRGGVLW